MTLVKTKDVVGDRRSVMQQARLAIRDIYDAIVELVTNSDDRYQHLNVDGTIEIVVERGRGKAERLLMFAERTREGPRTSPHLAMSRSSPLLLRTDSGMSAKSQMDLFSSSVAVVGHPPNAADRSAWKRGLELLSR